MTDEPTVLDFFKALVTPWRGAPPPLWGDESETAEKALVEQTAGAQASTDLLAPLDIAPREAISPTETKTVEKAPPRAITLPWRALIALLVALIAQRSLEPAPERTWTAGAIFYLVAAAWLVWADWRGEWQIEAHPVEQPAEFGLIYRPTLLLLGAVFGLAAFVTFGGDLFTPLNITLWLLSLFLVARAFWSTPLSTLVKNLASGFKKLKHMPWQVNISRWTLALFLLAGLAVFFRGYHLQQIPAEMTSDHAEKLMDVEDVLNGKTHIFFPRNTGREAIQFYLTAAVSRIFGTGISFLSLKIGTFFVGLITLVYIYLLGQELGGRETALWATAFAAIGYWPNAITRAALRFSLYPLFVAPTLYYLLRGLRRRSRNDMILAGLFLGLGLHGYTPFRIVPFIVVAAVGLYLLHRQSAGQRRQAIYMLVVLALISFMVFLPLLRYALEYPDNFAFRAFSRLGDWERPLPGPAWSIFLSNLWRAMIMFFWDNGQVWLVSIPNRPALDIVSAVLLFSGMVLLALRYVRQRHWQDIFLVLSIPMLMLPSILSLAFPDENPVLNRTSGALVPVFLIVGLSLAALRSKTEVKSGKTISWALAAALLAISAFQNYDLVFNKYAQQYQQASWNTSEMDNLVKDFIATSGNSEGVWVISYPYWVDTRLVGLNIGYAIKDYAISADRLESTLANRGFKLFILNQQDLASLDALRRYYPQGWLRRYISSTGTPEKDFLLYYAPPEQ